MVKEETVKFVEENRDLLRDVAARRKSPVAPLAAAMLISVEPEDEENESSKEKPQIDPNTDFLPELEESSESEATVASDNKRRG